MRGTGCFTRRISFCLLVMFSYILTGCAPHSPRVEEKTASGSLPTAEVKTASRSLPGLIQAALDAGQTTIRIPPGTYRVLPENGTHLVFRDLKDITIEAAGVEMLCTETTRAILIENCENFTLRGLSVDYDPLPFTQGELIEISQDRKSHVVQLKEGFPSAESVIPSKYIIHTPEGNLRYGSYYDFKAEPLPGNRLRVSGLHPHKDGQEQVGDLITVSAESVSGPYIPHAIHLHKSRGTVLEDITLYSSPVFGFFETHCSGSVYRRCVIDRRHNRLRSLNADGFHSKFAEVGPLLEDCQAFWQGDDGINICGAYHLVMGGEGDRLRVLAKRDLDIQPGDPVQLVDANGQARPNAKVLSVRKTGTLTDEDRQTLKKIPILWMVKNLLSEEFEIQLDRPVSMEAGGVIGSLNRMGNGFVIRGCRFGHIRSRGILVKAGDGLIENNILDQCAMQGIKVAPEYHWLESGFSENVTIRNNRILDPGREGILVATVGPYPLHRDIQILNNTIMTRNPLAVRIQGVTGGALRENHLQGLRPGQQAPTVTLTHSSDFLLDEQTP